MQIKPIFLLFVLCFALSVFPEDVVVDAQPNTIVVPDDYSSIFDAVGNASEGDTIYVKSGTYDGPINRSLVITQPLSLVGESAINTTLIIHPPLVESTIFTQSFWLPAIPINIKSDNVTFSGFTIIAPGGDTISGNGNSIQISNNVLNNGIFVIGDWLQIIENSIMHGRIRASGSYQLIRKNDINVTGFAIECGGSHSNITENSLVGSGGGIHVSGSSNVIWANNVTTESSINCGVDVSGDGNIIANNNLIDVMAIGGSNNLIYGNKVTTGFALAGFNNTLFENQGVMSIGPRGQNSENNTFYRNNFFGANPIELGEGVGPNFWDNGEEGNYWSAYNGTDTDGDGIGNKPYILNENNQDNYPLMNSIQIATIPEFPSFIVLVFVVLIGVIFTVSGRLSN